MRMKEREFIPDETFFVELQQIIEKYDLAQYNDQFFLSIEVMEELVSLFYPNDSVN